MPEQKMTPLVGWVVLDADYFPRVESFRYRRETAERELELMRGAYPSDFETRLYPRIARVRIEEIEDE